MNHTPTQFAGPGLIAWMQRLVILLVLLSSTALHAQQLDMCEFGNSASESAHGLVPTNTEVVTGALGQTARRSLITGQVNGGDLLLTMAVDPVKRNYFTIKYWGGDYDANRGRTYLYVVSGGLNYQVGYRHEGDYQVLNSTSDKPSLPGRFFYATTLLPLPMTQGRTTVTLRVQNTGRVYALGSGLAPAGNYQFLQTLEGRGIYRAYTHTDPLLIPTGETQGSAPATTTRTAPDEATLRPGGVFFTNVNNRVQSRLATAVSVTSFSTADAAYLARTYSIPGMVGYRNELLVRKVVSIIDAFATDYYTSGSGAASGGGNEGWGGRYGNLGQAITLLRPQLESALGVQVNYGPTGGTKTRRMAWGDILVASRDYGRLNRDGRAISNQCLLADESIYRANKGLLSLGDSRALTEAQAQRYLLEAIGLRPWKGSDLALTPGSGSSMKFGANYYMVTQKGLSREYGYVGGSYGEMSFYAGVFYRLTGNEEFRTQNIKMVKARANFRQPAVDVDVATGTNYRAMRVEGLLAWRGVGECDSEFSTQIAYGDRNGGPGLLLSAAASLDPALIGYAKQALLDNQVFPTVTSLLIADPDMLDVFQDYDIVKNAPDSGIRVPMSDGQPDYAWADEEEGIVAIKHGTERLWISPYWQAKINTGINGIGRFHYMTATYDQYGVLETNPQFAYSGLTITRPNQIDKPDVDAYTAPSSPTPPTQAYAGELLPTGASELVAAPSSLTGNYEPFMGRVDFYAFRFGNYLGGMNVSLRKPATLRVLNGESGTDLIAGGTFSGNVTLPARTTRLLYLPSAQDPTPVPTVPLLVTLSGTTATQTTLTWRATSGATSYTVKRGTTKGGPYTTLASGLTASPYTDPALASGTNYYIVVGVNANGESYPSMEANTAGYANTAAPSISSDLTAAGAVGQPFGYTIAALNTPTSFAATGLPAGLSVNANTGDITGTPTAAGTASITISATNATGTDTKTLVLTVAPASAPVLNGPATATGYVGTPFGYGVQATNTPTSYAATGLPAGLSIDANTGIISGAPTAVGSYPFTVSATNGGGTGSQAVTLQVLPPGAPVITSATTLSGVVSQALVYTIEATYGPTSFAAAGLPTGLSLNAATGVISGSPTQSGTFIIDLGATNGVGTGNDELVLTIPVPPYLPAPWVDADVNLPAGHAAGSATYNAGAFTVKGAGNDLASTSDGFNYLYQAQTTANSGNVVLIARLTTRTTSSTASKIGVMMRETVTGSSKDVVLFLDGSNGFARLANRATTGGSRTNTTGIAGGFSASAPLWFKMQRTGNVFEGFISANGTAYTSVGTATVAMNSAIQLGMVVCGRSASLTTAVFDNVSVNGVAVGTSPQAQAIAFNALPTVMVGDPDLDPAATASSGLRVIYYTSNPAVATIANGLIHIVGAGTATISAQQPGSDAYLAAPVVTRTLTVVQDLAVAAAQQMSVQGPYRNVTVQGTLTLSGPLTVSGTLTIASGGVLDTNCQAIAGAGTFTLAAGAELRICSASGISSSGASGSVLSTGARSFSPDASYTYTGTEAQATGSGLPAQVRNLAVQNPAGVTLTAGLSVAQVVRLTSGNLALAGQDLTLLSGAGGTALVDNTGGIVNGTATVQRYIDPNLNAGLGYRHYSAPTSSTDPASPNSTVADLTTSNFTPVVDPAVAFPTVYGYDEARLTPSANTFDQGWYPPASLSTPLAVGRGYTVNLPGTALVDFVGTLNNGPINLSLTRGVPSEAGWQLLGNPYPAPLDWQTVNVPTGLDNAVYVYQSTSQYGGQYRSYVNGVGSSSLVPVGQGFFVRVSAAGATPTLALTNANRVTTFAPQPSFNRPAETRPLVELRLSSAAGASDAAYVYFQPGATAASDAHYDAHKLRNIGPGAVSVFSLAAGEELSINALPLSGAQALVVPLGVAVAQAGTYTLHAEQLLNLSGDVFLRDAFTGTLVPLAQQPSYSFSVAAGATATGRFTLVFSPQRALGTATATLSQQVTLFPNPAQGEVQLSLPADLQAARVSATLLNALGQVVRTTVLPVTVGTVRSLSLAGLATGVYSLRLETSAGTVTKRLTVE